MSAGASVWDPIGEEAERDPMRVQDDLREHHRVAFSDQWGGFWSVSRYEDVKFVTECPALFSSAQSSVPPSRLPGQPQSRPLALDPPEHAAYRSALTKYFAPRRIQALESSIREIAVDLIEHSIRRGTVEAVSEITFELPVRVLCGFLGIPVEDGPMLKKWSNEMIVAGLARDLEAQRVAADKLIQHAYALIAQRRREPRDPGTDVVSGLIESVIDGRGLNDDEIVGVVRLLFVAGHGTTTNALGNAIYHLATHSDLQAELRANPSRIPSAIEELLRVYSPSRALARVATQDTEIAGTPIPEGGVVALLWGAANRDPAVFEDPGIFNMDRRDARHLAFGNGIHTCLGAPLARTELRVFIEELLARTADVTLVGEMSLARWPHFGPKSLPVMLVRAESRASTERTVAQKTEVREGDIPAVVVARRRVAEGVVELTLAAADGGPPLLPAEPGAHIDIVLPDGTARQYSLCGDPKWVGVWRVSVLLETASRGGSRTIHDAIEVGSRIQLRGPRNHFRFDEPNACVFVAGGIGITPMMSMIRRAEESGVEWKLLYLGSELSRMAYARELLAWGDRVVVHASRAAGRADISAFVATLTDGTVFCCGPSSVLEATKAAAEQAGLRFRAEAFGPLPIDEADGGLPTFEVELARTRRSVLVGPDESIVEACEREGVTVSSSCREGTCGSCETVVLGGKVAHRDSVLTDEDRASNAYMMPCISRAKSDRLILDL